MKILVISNVRAGKSDDDKDLKRGKAFVALAYT